VVSVLLAIIMFAPVAVLLFWLVMRDWYLEWGTTDHEALGMMTGDDLVVGPTYQMTLGVTIAAPSECVWPWLVQMGYRRGGLYSYDWLDRLFGYLDRPSSETVLSEFQRLEPGDTIPLGRGPAFPVAAVNPRRALVLSGAADGLRWTWQFELRAVNGHLTRLLSRNRARVPAGVGTAMAMWVLEPAAFIMTRKMLLGIKRRAESLAKQSDRSVRRAA